MNKQILSLLVCPIAKCPLQYDELQQELISQPLKLAYPIRHGIAIMLESEARQLKD